MGTGDVHSSEAGSRSRVFFQGLPWFSKDASFISFRPMAGGAMASASCKKSNKILNPRGLKHEELLKFMPVKAGSEFKFLPFQCQKLEGLFSHSKTFMWLYRRIINMSPPFKASDISCSKKPDTIHTLSLILPSKYLYLSHHPGLSLIGKSFFYPSHITEIQPKLSHRTTDN